MRASDLSEIVSIRINELFPEIPRGFIQDEGVDYLRSATEDALTHVDMSMIQPQHSVNILCSEHGFYLLGGHQYCEMLKTIRDVVQQNTGCRKIRLVLAAGMGARESDEIIRHFNLKEYFHGRVRGISAFDEGVPIETEIGTLYGLAEAYSSDWIIHAGHDEPRDLYFYRMIDRLLKAFIMSYARFETRSAYHGNFGNRSGAFLQRAMFDAPFVQKKFTFGCILRLTPAGVTGVSASNDLCRLGREITAELLRDYGKMLRLFAEIEDCIAILDGGRYGYYLHAGGIVFGCLENAKYDAFDLSQPAALAYFDMLGNMARGEDEKMDHIMFINPALKAVVVNQAWPGIPMAGLTLEVPTFVVGRELADTLRKDAANPSFMDLSQAVETFEDAITSAKEAAGTDKLLVFDGSFGYLNLSRSLAEDLIRKAPAVRQEVEDTLLPLWLKQRGIDPGTVSNGRG
ncbi:MAG: hypothetical protein RRA35_05620 [Desulfomonilia bacterium]|nr:hypothetical protein [Desulfomonilia bacterium]